MVEHAIVQWAGGKLGETEHPPGSNRGLFVDECQRFVHIDPEKDGGKPWCAAFACLAIHSGAAAAGVTLGFRSSGSTHKLLELNPGLIIPEPVALCVGLHFVDDLRGHTVLITAPYQDGRWTTIEGNSDASGSRTGGSVVSNLRPREYFHAFLRVE